jgi:hypothetical protein
MRHAYTIELRRNYNSVNNCYFDAKIALFEAQMEAWDGIAAGADSRHIVFMQTIP